MRSGELSWSQALSLLASYGRNIFRISFKRNFTPTPREESVTCPSVEDEGVGVPVADYLGASPDGDPSRFGEHASHFHWRRWSGDDPFANFLHGALRVGAALRLTAMSKPNGHQMWSDIPDETLEGLFLHAKEEMERRRRRREITEG